MLKVLIPVDGSENALRAVAHAVTLARNNAALSVELLHVHQAPSVREHAYRSHQQLEQIQHDETQQVLQPAQALLAMAGVAHTSASREGDTAQAIADSALQSQCDMIVMGIRGMGFVLGPVNLGSVSSKVLHATNVPVTLVK